MRYRRHAAPVHFLRHCLMLFVLFAVPKLAGCSTAHVGYVDSIRFNGIMYLHRPGFATLQRHDLGQRYDTVKAHLQDGTVSMLPYHADTQAISPTLRVQLDFAQAISYAQSGGGQR